MHILFEVAPTNPTPIFLGVTAAVIAALSVPLVYYFGKKYVRGKGKRSKRKEIFFKRNRVFNNNHKGGREDLTYECNNAPLYTSLDDSDGLNSSQCSQYFSRASTRMTRIDPSINSLQFIDNDDPYYLSSTLPIDIISRSVTNSKPNSAITTAKLVEDSASNPFTTATEKVSSQIDGFDSAEENCIVSTLPLDENSKFPQEDFYSSVIKNSNSAGISNRIQQSGKTTTVVSDPIILPNSLQANEGN